MNAASVVDWYHLLRRVHRGRPFMAAVKAPGVFSWVDGTALSILRVARVMAHRRRP